MKRIIIHWTGGTDYPNRVDLRHYHFLIDGTGKVHAGDHEPEANLDVSRGGYAAHTRRLNTGSIGVGLCGMLGAKERPFKTGDYPLTTEQMAALYELCADLCDVYDIPLGRNTVMTHAEVQGVTGVRQRGKWDLTWLPGYSMPVDADTVGARIRTKIAGAMASQDAPETATKPVAARKHTVKCPHCDSEIYLIC